MAVIPPLVFLNNQVRQLPSGDRVPSDVDLGGKKTTRGTTPPANPAIGDCFEEVTTTGQWVRAWVWNGTYWLSTQEFAKSYSLVNASAAATSVYFDIPPNVNLYILAFNSNVLLGTTNSAVSYWALTPFRANNNGSATSLTTAINSSSQSASTWWLVNNPINNHITVATTTTRALRVDVTKTGTPSNINGGFEISYRLSRL